MPIHNWKEVKREQMNPLFTRQVIHGDTMTLARLEMQKGSAVPVHHHHNEQITMLEKGSLRFVINGEEVILHAGEILRIPPHAPHSAEALDDVIAVDLFSPPREDWIRGDDAYLRK